MKPFSFLISSNIFISICAVFMAMETQVQLGMKPQWHPYLFIIFFATLFEYNLNPLVLAFTNKEALSHKRHRWIKDNPKLFYSVILFSAIGFIISVFLAKNEVLVALVPIGLLTIFYSLPVFKHLKYFFKLRQIPFLKIFLISFVWSVSTILLPIIQSNHDYNKAHVAFMLFERFVFVFAITIPFDIRDIQDDKSSGLKTIPVIMGEKTSLIIANLLLLLFLVVGLLHYMSFHVLYIIPGLILSAISTLFFINNRKIQAMPYYHYGVLDGTMLLQGVLMCGFYYLLNY